MARAKAHEPRVLEKIPVSFREFSKSMANSRGVLTPEYLEMRHAHVMLYDLWSYLKNKKESENAGTSSAKITAPAVSSMQSEAT